MRALQHFILTNFNALRNDYSRDRNGLPVCTPEWMEERFELFERFCWPSVRGQTNQNFTWLMRYDPATPAPYKERLESYTTFRNLRLLPATSFERVIVASLAPRTTHVLTTRLDNDDAFRCDVMDVLQSACAESRDLEFLNFPLGYCYVYASGATRLVEDRSNAFLSLIEPVSAKRPQTAVCVSHPQASEVAPVRQLRAEPSWLQVIHNRNLGNVVRGTPCAAPQLERAFNVRSTPAPR
jgi:Putative rhamnosyl transferase